MHLAMVYMQGNNNIVSSSREHYAGTYSYA